MQCPKFQFGTDDRIIRRDGTGDVPQDEPVFLLRGKDELAPHVITRYIEILAAYPESELARQHIESATERLDAILAWQAAWPDRVGMGCHTCERLDHRVRLSRA